MPELNASAEAKSLQGRTLIVTGAGRQSSLGHAIALEFARHGVNIVLTGTRRSPRHFPPAEQRTGWRDVDSVADEIAILGGQALALRVDISSLTEVDALFSRATERFGSIDFVINNAAAPRGADRAPVSEMPPDAWEHVVKVNLTGTFLMCRAAARALLAHDRGGCILNISSIASRLASAHNGAYSATKSAINALSRTMAIELAPRSIRVNAVLPGITETSRNDGLDWDRYLALIPLQRPGRPEDVARLCLFLCSDAGAWITGQDIAVDGGSSWR